MIKRIKIIALFFVVSLFFAGVAGAATTSTTLSVSTTVIPTCTVSATPVNFGSTDGQTTVYSNGGVTVNCVTGTVYNITLDGGLRASANWRQLADGAGNFLNYELGRPTFGEWGDSGYANTYLWGTSVGGTGTGVEQPYVVYGRLYTGSVPPGTYTDVVNVTVNY